MQPHKRSSSGQKWLKRIPIEDHQVYAVRLGQTENGIWHRACELIVA